VQYLPLTSQVDRAAALRGVAGSELLALDGLQAIAGDRAAEHALFDLYNRTRAEGGALLFAADTSVAQLALGLPDLRSRLGACTQFTLKPLDDADRREVLKSQAVLRGIQLDDAVLDWLFSRYARDLGALLDLLDKLDQASLAAQRRITVPFLRDFLRDATEP
jgi:DnaA family protein